MRTTTAPVFVTSVFVKRWRRVGLTAALVTLLTTGARSAPTPDLTVVDAHLLPGSTAIGLRLSVGNDRRERVLSACGSPLSQQMACLATRLQAPGAQFENLSAARFQHLSFGVDGFAPVAGASVQDTAKMPRGRWHLIVDSGPSSRARLGDMVRELTQLLDSRPADEFRVTSFVDGNVSGDTEWVAREVAAISVAAIRPNRSDVDGRTPIEEILNQVVGAVDPTNVRPTWIVIASSAHPSATPEAGSKTQKRVPWRDKLRVALRGGGHRTNPVLSLWFPSRNTRGTKRNLAFRQMAALARPAAGDYLAVIPFGITATKRELAAEAEAYRSATLRRVNLPSPCLQKGSRHRVKTFLDGDPIVSSGSTSDILRLGDTHASVPLVATLAAQAPTGRRFVINGDFCWGRDAKQATVTLQVLRGKDTAMVSAEVIGVSPTRATVRLPAEPTLLAPGDRITAMMLRDQSTGRLGTIDLAYEMPGRPVWPLWALGSGLALAAVAGLGFALRKFAIKPTAADREPPRRHLVSSVPVVFGNEATHAADLGTSPLGSSPKYDSGAMLVGKLGRHAIGPGRQVLVGRDAGRATLRIDSPAVAPIHATLKFESHQLYVRAEPSAPTSINGVRIQGFEWHSVPANGRLRFGTSEFVAQPSSPPLV